MHAHALHPQLSPWSVTPRPSHEEQLLLDPDPNVTNGIAVINVGDRPSCDLPIADQDLAQTMPEKRFRSLNANLHAMQTLLTIASIT